MKRKLLVTTMVLSIVLSSAMTAAAAESFTTPSTEERHTESTPTESSSSPTATTSEGEHTSSSSVASIESTTVNVSCTCNQNSNENSSDSESNITAEPERKPTYEEQHSQSANSTVTIAGTEVKTSIAGVYAANNVQGCAVITSSSDVRTALNLNDGQIPNIIIYDVNEIQSSAAMASINAVSEFICAGDTVSTIYIDLCAKEDGQKIELSSGSVSMSVGLPQEADMSKDYIVICVQSGGSYIVLEDKDINSSTVTFDAQAGIGTYAVVEKLSTTQIAK